MNSEYQTPHPDPPELQIIFSKQTAGLCYTQALNNGIFTACEYILRRVLSVTLLRNLPVNKRP